MFNVQYWMKNKVVTPNEMRNLGFIFFIINKHKETTTSLRYYIHFIPLFRKLVLAETWICRRHKRSEAISFLNVKQTTVTQSPGRIYNFISFIISGLETHTC